MWPNPQETRHLVTFTEDILNGNFIFFCTLWMMIISLITRLTFDGNTLTFCELRFMVRTKERIEWLMRLVFLIILIRDLTINQSFHSERCNIWVLRSFSLTRDLIEILHPWFDWFLLIQTRIKFSDFISNLGGSKKNHLKLFCFMFFSEICRTFKLCTSSNE